MTTSDGIESRDKKFRLIFHIGAGKTGTSSIQESLRQSTDSLHRSGIDYWGLMLEFAPVQKFIWQKPPATKEFLSLEDDEAKKQVYEALSESIQVSREQGFNTAIWSNEWFFGREKNVLPALKLLKDDGCQVEIISYVRRHDAWARSAYVQWGIKHKSYQGPIRPFKQYIKERPVRFFGTLKPWMEAFPDTFVLRNFDTAKDVVQDFLWVSGISSDVSSVRVNEAPSAEELLLRAIYNDSVKGEALPVQFDRRFQSRHLDFSRKPSDWLASLMPTRDDLSGVLEETQADREQVNRLLEAAHQPPLSDAPTPVKKAEVDGEILNAALIQMIFHQNKRIHALERRVRELMTEKGSDQ